MKTLTLIRHAKSSWNDPGLSDFDRTLNARGERDAPRIGRRLKQNKLSPDCLVSSPACRAKSTADLIARELELSHERIQLEPRIYEASAVDLLGVIRSWPDEWNNVVLIGHNPGLTDLAEKITGSHFGNVPTCGVLQLSVPGDWAGIDGGTCDLLNLIEPKRLDDEHK